MPLGTGLRFPFTTPPFLPDDEEEGAHDLLDRYRPATPTAVAPMPDPDTPAAPAPGLPMRPRTVQPAAGSGDIFKYRRAEANGVRPDPDVDLNGIAANAAFTPTVGTTLGPRSITEYARAKAAPSVVDENIDTDDEGARVAMNLPAYAPTGSPEAERAGSDYIRKGVDDATARQQGGFWHRLLNAGKALGHSFLSGNSLPQVLVDSVAGYRRGRTGNGNMGLYGDTVRADQARLTDQYARARRSDMADTAYKEAQAGHLDRESRGIRTDPVNWQTQEVSDGQGGSKLVQVNPETGDVRDVTAGGVALSPWHKPDADKTRLGEGTVTTLDAQGHPVYEAAPNAPPSTAEQQVRRDREQAARFRYESNQPLQEGDAEILGMPAEYTGKSRSDFLPTKETAADRKARRATFLKGYGTSDEGKKVYEASVGAAMGPMLGDIPATREGIQGEMAKVRARIDDLKSQVQYVKAHKNEILAGREGSEDQSAPLPDAMVAGYEAEIGQLNGRWQALSQAHRAAESDVEKRAGLDFDEQDTGDNETPPAAAPKTSASRGAASLGGQRTKKGGYAFLERKAAEYKSTGGKSGYSPDDVAKGKAFIDDPKNGYK